MSVVGQAMEFGRQPRGGWEFIGDGSHLVVLCTLSVMVISRFYFRVSDSMCYSYGVVVSIVVSISLTNENWGGGQWKFGIYYWGWMRIVQCASIVMCSRIDRRSVRCKQSISLRKKKRQQR